MPPGLFQNPQQKMMPNDNFMMNQQMPNFMQQNMPKSN